MPDFVLLILSVDLHHDLLFGMRGMSFFILLQPSDEFLQ